MKNVDARTLFSDWTMQNGGMMKGGFGFLAPSARAEIEYYAKRINEKIDMQRELVETLKSLEPFFNNLSGARVRAIQSAIANAEAR